MSKEQIIEKLCCIGYYQCDYTDVYPHIVVKLDGRTFDGAVFGDTINWSEVFEDGRTEEFCHTHA